MSENACKELSDKEVEQLSSVEFSSQAYASFYNTTLEKDKSILTLSVAGIGFLLTMLQLVKHISIFDLVSFSVASISYLLSVYSVITIFGVNSKFIIELVNKRNVSVYQYKLDVLDKIAIRSFYVAVIMTIVFGASTAQIFLTIGE